MNLKIDFTFSNFDSLKFQFLSPSIDIADGGEGCVNILAMKTDIQVTVQVPAHRLVWGFVF